VKTSDEMRMLLGKIEDYWKGHVQRLYDELYATNQEICKVIDFFQGDTDQLK
jgi:hypothetical protein